MRVPRVPLTGDASALPLNHGCHAPGSRHESLFLLGPISNAAVKIFISNCQGFWQKLHRSSSCHPQSLACHAKHTLTNREVSCLHVFSPCRDSAHPSISASKEKTVSRKKRLSSRGSIAPSLKHFSSLPAALQHACRSGQDAMSLFGSPRPADDACSLKYVSR